MAKFVRKEKCKKHEDVRKHRKITRIKQHIIL